jgi:uncharacterized protein YodC (DUF2158 family)
VTIGSVVRLRSGGPRMTITGHHTEPGWSSSRYWKCEWFEGTVLRVESFPAAGLVVCDAPDEEQSS